MIVNLTMPVYFFFAVMFGALIASFVLFDQLVRREYAEHKRDWSVDGNPHGFFFVPLESWSFWANFLGGISSHRCAMKWLFSTPEWVRHDARARWLLRFYRVAVLSFNLGPVVFIIGLMIAQ